MAEGTIRVNKILKDFNISLPTFTDFLKKKGIETEEITLTSKVSEDVYSLLLKEYGNEQQLLMAQSRQVSNKLKEVASAEKEHAVAGEEEPVKEIFIKTNVLTTERPAEKPSGGTRTQTGRKRQDSR